MDWSVFLKGMTVNIWKTKNYHVADRSLTLRERNLIAAYQVGIIDFFQYLELWRAE